MRESCLWSTKLRFMYSHTLLSDTRKPHNNCIYHMIWAKQSIFGGQTTSLYIVLRFSGFCKELVFYSYAKVCTSKRIAQIVVYVLSICCVLIYIFGDTSKILGIHHHVLLLSIVSEVFE